jgi:hypothetical protein
MAKVTGDAAYSTLLDSLLFLVMVSIASVVLMPALMGSAQIKSASEVQSQSHSSMILLTVLNGRVDELDYRVGGEQMDALASAAGVDPSDSESVYRKATQWIAGREPRHKTFADLAAESAASQFTIYLNGSSIKLNFLTGDFNSTATQKLKEHIDSQIGGMYDYRLDITWRPFPSAPLGGEIKIGGTPPENAYATSAYVTMPCHTDLTRDGIESEISGVLKEETGYTFGELVSGKLKERSESGIAKIINESLDALVYKAADALVDDCIGGMFDSQLESATTGAFGNVIGNGSLLGENIDSFKNSLGDALKDSLPGDFDSNYTASSAWTKNLVTDAVGSGVHGLLGAQVRKIASEVVNAYSAGTLSASGVKETLLDFISSQVQISRAKATLYLWEKHK